jgi:hypothetical protein
MGLMLSSFAVLCVLKTRCDIFVAPAAGNNIKTSITVHAVVQYVQISERQTLLLKNEANYRLFFFAQGLFHIRPL